MLRVRLRQLTMSALTPSKFCERPCIPECIVPYSLLLGMGLCWTWFPSEYLDSYSDKYKPLSDQHLLDYQTQTRCQCALLDRGPLQSPFSKRALKDPVSTQVACYFLPLVLILGVIISPWYARIFVLWLRLRKVFLVVFLAGAPH